MWINKIKYSLLLFLILSSCSQEQNTKIEYEYVNYDSLVTYKVENYQKDSSIIIKLILYNNSQQDIFIPISNWLCLDFYSGIISFQDTTFKGTRNLIMYSHNFQIGIDRTVYGVIDIRVFPELTKWPQFVLLKSLDSLRLKLEVTRKDGYNYTRFKDKEQYKFWIQISMVNANKFYQIFGSSILSENLISNHHFIDVPNSTKDKFEQMQNETNIPINETDSEILNKLCNNKLNIYFNIQF